MGDVRVIKVKQSVFANNDARADELRRKLKAKKVFLINLMSSPGSGKTTMLVSLINRLKDKLRIGVMEADMDAVVDAKTIETKTGVKTIQLHTSGECHLDAKMTEEGVESFGVDGLDLVILENIGNLVCPAEFDTGATLNMTILSIPEGDDKPLKYPLMFTVSTLFVFSKMDAVSFFDFDLKKAEERILRLNKKAVFFPISAKTGMGMDELAAYIEKEVRAYQKA
ncbi:MAG: hydrogenase nickel incorporation protein HypB [Bacilli bacterium]|jgi:hydrogenase nickel incorporation protein HypB|nr:hydrogenase nickel incorporation protein HypB [Bacilli bacterium]